jgi:hypothetical protein
MKTTIVTHPGRAHRDDFLAVCWLLGDVTDSPEVYRREPTQEDLDDSTVYVLDIGGQYDPRRRNFDHHQLPADSPPTCALQLLLEYELGTEVAHQTFPWLFVTGLFDSKGPRAVAEHFGIPTKSLGQLASPLEALILEMFAQVSYMHPSDALHKVMTAIGFNMWERANNFAKAKAQVGAVVWELTKGDTRFYALAALGDTRNMTHPAYLPEIMELKRREAVEQGADPVVSISPSLDGRSDGWTLYRYGDNKNVDFNRIRVNPKVNFVHANGFLAKVGMDVTLDDLLAMVKESFQTDAEKLAELEVWLHSRSFRLLSRSSHCHV